MFSKTQKPAGLEQGNQNVLIAFFVSFSLFLCSLLGPGHACGSTALMHDCVRLLSGSLRRIRTARATRRNQAPKLAPSPISNLLRRRIRENPRFGVCGPQDGKRGTERVQTFFGICVSMVGPEGFEPPTKRL
jgi:hypothetical protein